MDHWKGVLRVPLGPSSNSYCRVAVSLCLSSFSSSLLVSFHLIFVVLFYICTTSESNFWWQVPSANAIFFSGDRVEGTRNPVIERLSDLQNIADNLVSKFGASINAWVIEAPVFNGPFAVYRDFIPSVNRWGEPKFYSAAEFPASSSTISLLSNCLKEVC